MLNKNFKLIMCMAFMMVMFIAAAQSAYAAQYSAQVIDNSNRIAFTAREYGVYVSGCNNSTSFAGFFGCIEKAELLIRILSEVPFQLEKVKPGLGPRPIADMNFLTNATLLKIDSQAISLTNNKGGFSTFLDSNQARLGEVTNQLKADISNMKLKKSPQRIVTNPKHNNIDCVPLFIGIDIIGLTGVRQDYIPYMNASMSRCF
jgi:hypothetical protein